MSTKHMYIVLFAAATAAGSLLRFLDAGLAVTAVGVIVLAAFSHCSYRGMEIDRVLTAKLHLFSPLSPSHRSGMNRSLPGGLVMSQANFYGRDTFLRAGCIPTEARFLPTREGVIAELRKYADSDGLRDANFEIIESDGFVRGVARGRKIASGNAATYLLADRASIMSLTAGGVSSGCPQPGITEFLTSGTHLGAEAR